MRRCLALAAAAALSLLAASAAAQTLARGAMLGIGMSADSAGIRIASVAPGGSAEASGLKPGDVITAIGDASGDALQDALKAALKKPQTIAFKVLRNGAETEIPARVANHYHPGTADFQMVPQTDHVFFRKTSEADAKANAFKGDFNPAIIGIVADWMDRTKGGA
jgi:predicted metalloprotease with PDZ domain